MWNRKGFPVVMVQIDGLMRTKREDDIDARIVEAIATFEQMAIVHPWVCGVTSGDIVKDMKTFGQSIIPGTTTSVAAAMKMYADERRRVLVICSRSEKEALVYAAGDNPFVQYAAYDCNADDIDCLLRALADAGEKLVEMF